MANKKRSKRRGPTAPKPLSRAAFERELRRVVDGDPGADPTVSQFWRELTATSRIGIAVSHPQGVEVLRNRPKGQ